MKKILLTFILIDILFSLKAQWNGSSSVENIWREGNVGIGVATPYGKLSIGGENQIFNFLLNQKLTGSLPPVSELSTFTLQSSGYHAGNIAFATGNTEIMRISNTGRVGIGTTNPSAKFDVFVTATTNGNDVIANFQREAAATGGSGIIRLGSFITSDLEINSSYSSNGFRYGTYSDFNIVNNATGTYGSVNLVTNGAIQLSVKPTGNIGIGTTNPSAKLSVLGEISRLTTSGVDGTFDNVIKYGHKSDLESGTANANRWHGIDATITAGDAASNKLKFRMYKGGADNASPIDVMILQGDGNVGIGTNPGDYKLNVWGRVRADEIVVNTTGADFVFEPSYKLRSLNELESYIKEHKHLPEIAPAKEMQENGVSAGEMQTKLLQKIEELTLYLIEQSKPLEVLKKENDQLKADRDAQQELNTELQKTILEMKNEIETIKKANK